MLIIENQINRVGYINVVVLISILCFLPLFKGSPGRKWRRRVRWEVRFEMQDVSFEGLAFGRFEHGIMLI